jgi:hypothetical protein
MPVRAHTGYGGLGTPAGLAGSFSSPSSLMGPGHMMGMYGSHLNHPYGHTAGYPLTPFTPGAVPPVIPPAASMMGGLGYPAASVYPPGTYPAAAGYPGVSGVVPGMTSPLVTPAGPVVHTSSAGLTTHPDDVEASGFFTGMGTP